VDDLVAKILATAKDRLPRVRLEQIIKKGFPVGELGKETEEIAPITGTSGKTRLVAIGCSTGGPAALQQVLPALPRNFPVPVVIVQHIPIGFSQALAEQLDSKSKIKVCHSNEGDLLLPGHAYIAQAGFDLNFRKHSNNVVLHLEKGTTPLPPGGLRPSADVMMVNATRLFGSGVLGVIMTGMGRDGEKGMTEIKKRKGRTIAEAQSTCVVYGMPRAVAEANVVDKVVPLGKIAQEIIKML
jgi:two-component system chemotaxis response regulator CheB